MIFQDKWSLVAVWSPKTGFTVVIYVYGSNMSAASYDQPKQLAKTYGGVWDLTIDHASQNTVVDKMICINVNKGSDGLCKTAISTKRIPPNQWNGYWELWKR